MIGPGARGMAVTDLDGDGRCEDVNGNNRLDFSDVVLLFTILGDRSVTYEETSSFDFNGNGRLDFADIVALFERL